MNTVVKNYNGTNHPTVMPRKKTNADRIRNMTDEELAKYIFLILADYACPPYQNMDSCKKKNATFDVCESCWLEWLKQEVE